MTPYLYRRGIGPQTKLGVYYPFLYRLELWKFGIELSVTGSRNMASDSDTGQTISSAKRFDVMRQNVNVNCNCNVTVVCNLPVDPSCARLVAFCSKPEIFVFVARIRLEQLCPEISVSVEKWLVLRTWLSAWRKIFSTDSRRASSNCALSEVEIWRLLLPRHLWRWHKVCYILYATLVGLVFRMLNVKMLNVGRNSTDVFTKSHPGFRSLPNSVTLSDLERPNGVTSHNMAAVGSNCVKFVEG